MKKIIGMVFICLMFANIGFAEIKLIEKKAMPAAYTISTFCVDGYKFVVMRRVDGVSMVQSWEQVCGVPGTASQPAKC